MLGYEKLTIKVNAGRVVVGLGLEFKTQFLPHTPASPLGHEITLVEIFNAVGHLYLFLN